MDAVELVIQKGRLCKNRACSDCVIEEECRMVNPDRINAERMVEKVEQWSKDHPVKTRQSEFLKMFPNVSIDSQNAINISPCRLDKTIKLVACSSDCLRCRREYWRQEVE